jgi:hypothetical protein
VQDEISFCQISKQSLGKDNPRAIIAVMAELLDKIDEVLGGIESPTHAPVNVRKIATLLGYDEKELSERSIPDK